MAVNTGVNKVILLGEVLSAPRCHTYNDNRREYHFTLVTKEKLIKKKEPAEHLEQHHIRVVADVLNPPVKLEKGQCLHVEGKIRTTRMVDEGDIKRYKTEVIASSIVAV